MRPHGRSSVSARNPRAFGICDRCGFLYNHHQLQWQFDYAGAGLINKRILVCNPCLDTPQAQLRAIVLPADPTPIDNPRIQDYSAAENGNISLTSSSKDFWTGIPTPSTTDIATENGNNINTQPIGRPTGLDPRAQMPLVNDVSYFSLNPLSIFANGTSTVTVTFASPHGLSTNNQVSVEGALNNNADGIYSIVVTTATAFTYQVNNAIPSGGLLQPTTLMATANVGVPLNYDTIPLTGP